MAQRSTERVEVTTNRCPPGGLSRRAMLGGTAVAAVAGCCPAIGRADKPPAGRHRASCTLGFSTYGMQGIRTERAIETLGQIGFDSVEVAVRDGWDADSKQLEPRRRQSIRSLLSSSGIQLTSLMEHVYPSDPRQQAIALERLRLAAGVAHDLSPAAPPHIQTVLGGGDFGRVKHQLCDRLAEWVKVADATDTLIAIKPHRGGVVSQPAEAVWLIEQLGKPSRLRMVYDYSHYAFRDLPMAETIRTALPYTQYIAVKDAVRRDGKVSFQLPGQAGTIDFVGLLKQFSAGGYHGDINCEVSSMIWQQPGYDPVAAARTCYANLARAFEKAHVERPDRRAGRGQAGRTGV